MAEMVEAVLNGHYKMILPKHRADRPEWYRPEGWEGPRLDRLQGEINWQKSKGKDPVIYYVGAEEGEMCALCAMWGAKVLMFEPNHRVMPNMRAIWEANNLPMNDLFFDGFAGNEVRGPQGLTLISDIEGDVIHDHGFKELRDPGDMAITTIDHQVELTGIVPTLLTMDVEGSEWEVLQGAEKTLDEHHPTIFLSLHPEFLINQYNKYSYEVRRWLIDKGYKETLLDYQHEAHFLYIK
jgi:FkbM family methyltransferase